MNLFKRRDRKKGKEKTIDELRQLEAEFRYKGDNTRAITVLDDVIKRNPNLSWAHNNKGGILSMSQQYQDAIPCFEKALTLDPNNGQSHNNLGYCYYATGNPEKAIPCYQKALKHDYTHEGVNYNLGKAYFAMGDTKEALDQWEIVMRKNPFYTALVSELYRIGQAVGAVIIGESVNVETIDKIRKALKTCKIEIVRNSTNSDMNFIITRDN